MIVVMSSARDEQPDTVPPPAGEEDAYSAATKVGSMPAELMARLRAEGLLPDEDPVDAQRPPPPRPATALVPRPTPVPSGLTDSAFDDVPALSSDPPPAGGASASSPVTAPAVPAPAAPDPAASSHEQQPVPSGVTTAAAGQVETPIAFVSPPSAPMDVAGPQSSAPVADDANAARAFGGRSRAQTIAVLVAIVIALVGFAFAMALLSQRR